MILFVFVIRIGCEIFQGTLTFLRSFGLKDIGLEGAGQNMQIRGIFIDFDLSCHEIREKADLPL